MPSDHGTDEPRRPPVTILRREPRMRGAMSSVVHGRCPRCRRGRIFTRLLRMAPECEICGLRFEREPGYFTGAMYVSYVIALPIFVGLFLLLRRVVPALAVEAALGMTVALFLPFVPFVFRFSRILWIHFDRAIDGDE